MIIIPFTEDWAMKSHWIFLLIGLISSCIGNAFCRGEEPDLTLDSVLEKWEKASQECKILDTKLTMFRYDRFVSVVKPKIEYGRFYYEYPTVGRIDIGKTPVTEANNWPALQYSYLWNGKESLRIDPKKCVCEKVPIEKIQEYLENPPQGFLARMGYDIGLALSPPLRPQMLWPLMIDVRAEDIRKDFDVSFSRQNNELLITAIPKKNTPVQKSYSRIRVLLDSTTFRTIGVQYVYLGDKEVNSVALYEQKINEQPSDRDQLIEPDLSGFRVEEFK
jgi:hypothetical protein